MIRNNPEKYNLSEDEAYAYNLWNELTDDKLASKFEANDKSQLELAVNETSTWLDSMQEAPKEECGLMFHPLVIMTM